jgi:DNA-binding MarR family transcriptional regulator
MATQSLQAAALAELLDLTSRLLHSRGYAADLFPAQWVALRYFAKAPVEKRTSSELARFQGLANGPVSRTVRTLIQKGLVAKAADQPKGRAEILELTPEGQALMAGDPLLEIANILGALPADERAVLAKALEQILRGIHGIRA